MTHIDLFSGIGGFALAARWAGFKTVCFVEIDPYAQQVIKKNFGAVEESNSLRLEKHRMCGTALLERPSENGSSNESAQTILHSDIRTFSGTRYRNATLLTGGFPCQPFSQAGKRRGKEDDRYLWPEMLRVISEARPRWVVGENVAGIVTMELDRVLSDLEGEGYSVQALVIPACAVDAKHRRDRVWIVGYAESGRQQEQRINESDGAQWASVERAGEDVADGGVTIQRRGSWAWGRKREYSETQNTCGRGNGQADGKWLPESNVGRSPDDVPDWLDRHIGKGMTYEQSLGSIETLRELWNANVSQALWRSARGLSRIQQAEVLFSFVREYKKDSHEARLLVEGKKASEEFLRELRRQAATERPSHRPKQSQQRSDEHSDTLQMVSQLPSCDGEATWPCYGWEDGLPRVETGLPRRVDRLKGLGNAIVPQVAYEILKGIAELECP